MTIEYLPGIPVNATACQEPQLIVVTVFSPVFTQNGVQILKEVGLLGNIQWLFLPHMYSLPFSVDTKHFLITSYLTCWTFISCELISVKKNSFSIICILRNL